MRVRVMITDEPYREPSVRVDAALGLGFHAMPIYEKERIVDAALSEAREQVMQAILDEAGAAA